LYYISRERVNAPGEGMVFADTKEVSRALGNKQVHLHARIKVRVHEVVPDQEGNEYERTFIADTSAGRCKLWEIVPKGLAFEMVNQAMTKKSISRLLNQCYRVLGPKHTCICADQLMYLGFR